MTWIIKRTNQFKKNYKTLPFYIQDKFKHNFQKFLKDPYDTSLKTHKLQGKMSIYTSSNINDDYRFITQFDVSKKEVLLMNI